MPAVSISSGHVRYSLAAKIVICDVMRGGAARLVAVSSFLLFQKVLIVGLLLFFYDSDL